MNGTLLAGSVIGKGWMTAERDIYASAHLWISRHGPLAECEADRMIELANERGHEAGTAVWRRIACAVRTLRSQTVRRLN